MNSYDWGGFPLDEDEDDIDETTERDAYDWARHVMSDDHWEATKESDWT